MLTNKLNTFVKLILANTCGMAKNYGTCVFNLVIEKLAKVFHIHLALFGVNYGCIAVEHNVVGINVLNGSDYIAKLTDT